ncbi:FtsX-like permease family protein [Eubacteriales bacterium KG127]
MKNKLVLKMAWRNLKAYKNFQIPFIISASMMGMLFFVAASLLDNNFVNTRHKLLIQVIFFSTIIVGIFSAVFIAYANKLISKERTRELSLYGILGLEKKHINSIMIAEQNICFGIITLMSIAGGRILGKITFLLLNKITGSAGVPLMEYPLTLNPIIITLIMLLLVYLAIVLRGVGKIYKSSPIELMSSNKKPESEPKSRWILTILGSLFLGGGYFVALTTEGTLKALFTFFGAVLAVIVGTYLLFISLGTIVLKLLRRRKKYYYKAENFLTISGMLYRVKGNSLSLASVALLSTSIILTISMTSMAYLQTDKIVNRVMIDDNMLEITQSFAGNYYDQKNIKGDDIKQKLNKINRGKEKISDFRYTKSVLGCGSYKNGRLESFSKGDKKIGDVLFVVAVTLDGYNKVMGTNYTLASDEIMIANAEKKMIGIKTINIYDKDTKVKKHLKKGFNGNLGVDSCTIVLPTEVDLKNFASSYEDGVGNANENLNYKIKAFWNIKNKEANYEDRIEKVFDEYGAFQFQSRDETKKEIMAVNGGFLFLGILVGSIFLMGTILVIYYKQISEGLADRKNYQIMSKVGMPDSIVRKTTRTQILWIFFLPLVVAIVHCSFASKMVFQLMRLFGITDIWFFAENLMIVTGVFIVIYLITFIMTSKVYYKTVS